MSIKLKLDTHSALKNFRIGRICLLILHNMFQVLCDNRIDWVDYSAILANCAASQFDSLTSHPCSDMSQEYLCARKRILPSNLRNIFNGQILLNRSLVGTEHCEPVKRASNYNRPKTVPYCWIGAHSGTEN